MKFAARSCGDAHAFRALAACREIGLVNQEPERDLFALA